MTHAEAVEEMKRLAGNRVWALEHEVASYHPVWIHGYIEREGQGHAASSNTYAGAIANVKVMLATEYSPDDPAPEEKEEAA